MKSMLMFFMTITAVSFQLGTAHADENGNRIRACSRAMGVFLQGTKSVIRGTNEFGSCFLSSNVSDGHINMFVNSKGSQYVASVEIADLKNSPTGISNTMQSCEITKNSISIRNTYRIPRMMFFGSGGVSHTPSIFDSVNRQTVELQKDSRGRLISASIRTSRAGLQTCEFAR